MKHLRVLTLDIALGIRTKEISFFKLQVYQRLGISPVQVYKRVEKSVIWIGLWSFLYKVVSVQVYSVELVSRTWLKERRMNIHLKGFSCSCAKFVSKQPVSFGPEKRSKRANGLILWLSKSRGNVLVL